MRFTLAFAALLGNALAMSTDMLPEEAIGDCADSTECAEGEYCVYTWIVPEEEDGEGTYEPSVCGAEADCAADDKEEKVAGESWSWCDEFVMDMKLMDKEGEDSSMRLVAASMAASFTAFAFAM